ncbi:MAG: hypothetical protein ACOYBO_10725 [Azonexus sp.]
MIKLHELNPQTRGWVETLPEEEQAKVLDLATDLMMTMEQRNCRARLGENGSVELAIKTILFVSERGTIHE